MKYKLITQWDICQIVTKEVEYEKEKLKEEGEEIPSDEILWNDIETNSFIFEREWDEVCELLTDTMNKLNKRYKHKNKWKIEVNNFGWKKVDGWKIVTAVTGLEMLREILPQTDCTFKIFYDGEQIKIQNWHHDSPTGNECYYIKPMSSKEVEENV